MTGGDTAERSLEHWTEAGRREMEAFYAIAGRDYRLLAQAVGWGELLADAARGTGRVALLDVACGSGKFPAALLRHAALGSGVAVDYDLLDPSPFSLAEARRQLAPPFRPGAAHESTLQDLDVGAGRFDVVWATHALYALAPDELGRGVAVFTRAIAPGGWGFIAHASHSAHYLRFYRLFLADFRAGSGTPYTSSEEIVAALAARGTATHVERLDYAGEARLEDRLTVEGYLQRCAFDDTVPLAEMEAAPTLGPYLAACVDADAGLYRFPQHVDLIFVGRDLLPPPRAPARRG